MRATADFDEIVVFGARGHSRMILSGLEEFWQGRVRLRAFVDDIENGFDHPDLGIPVISSLMRRRLYPDLPVLLTMGSGALRERVAQKLAAEGATLATAICAPQPHVDPTASFGPGAVCVSHVRVGPMVRIGALSQVLASVVGHDVTIGCNATLGIDSLLLGHVQVGDGVTISPRATIANGRRDRPLVIGDGAQIGVGAVVLQDVAPGARLIGNPAMPVRDWVRLRRMARASAGR